MTPKPKLLLGAMLGLSTLMAWPASAHVTFESKEVKAGGTVKFVLRIPHGCAGSPTTAVRVSIPEELTEVRPQPKPGWTLDINKVEAQGDGAPAAGHASHGEDEEALIKEISWSGGRLEAAHYDEFAFRAKVSADADAGKLFVPIVQQCETGVERWIEIPPAGGSSDALKFPAPWVKVSPGS